MTKRKTTQTGQQLEYAESNWTYDAIGRVDYQNVIKKTSGGGPTTVAYQKLAYFGNDDPKYLEHAIGASTKKLEFGYDRRHQLIDVIETAAGGAFSADYAFSTSGRFSIATVAAATLPGGEVRNRDVSYHYGAEDPEQLSQLTIRSGPLVGTPYATYDYDAAGNQTRRTYYTDRTGNVLLSGPETWLFTYDGENQLRRVVAPNGQKEEYWYDQDGKRILVRKSSAAGTPTEWRQFHNNTELEWGPNGSGAPQLNKTWAYASLGTPVARIENRNDRMELQFHGPRWTPKTGQSWTPENRPVVAH